MAEGLSWELVKDPGYAFARGAEFVQTFGAQLGAHALNPMQHPLAYAEAIAPLNPRHPESVFKQPGSATDIAEGLYADRYAVADNGLPAWAVPYEDVINNTAHDLGIRDREIGSTFQHDFSPTGHFDIGVALEGAKRQDELRSIALAEAIRRGEITVGRFVVSSTDRIVGEKEDHKPITIGHGVAAKALVRLYEDYDDLFGQGGIPLDTFQARTHFADTRETLTETVIRHNGVRSVVMAGSNIYGSWMRTDLATVAHKMGLDRISFGAGPDDPKAARTPLIWAAEVAQNLVSAAHLQHARLTKRR